MTANDLHYLRSILGHLREVRRFKERYDRSLPSLGGEVLADNIDWLDCFIDKHQRAQTHSSAQDRDDAAKQRRKLVVPVTET